jgi:hypothetical protein
MGSAIQQICALSVICGLLLHLAPEGTVRKAMAFASSVVLLACLVQAIRGLDLESYALSLSQNREREQEFLAHSEETRDALDRLVIEREYGAYIMDTARLLQVPLQSAEVEARWSTEGLWIPYAAKLIGEPDEEGKAALTSRIQADLGIPAERQSWAAG